jgi:aldehyde dehydrogenase (NAD+)/coniferyl-aldehyde dehydrogenase
LEAEAPTALESAFLKLRAAARREPFPELRSRRQWLRALLELTRACQDAVAQAVSDDFGHRSTHESKLGETWVTASNLDYLAEHFEAWLEPQPKRVAWPLWFGRAEVRVQPKGVVGIISPWNYPFMLAVEQLAGALCAGNRVLLKLSEHTPRSSALLAAEIHKRLPSDVVRVFTGGADEGAELCRLPLDHLLFTGSTAVGRKVYQAAARGLVPVTLELGGKSPAILHESYSVDRFAESVLSGKCFSAGQTCVAPDYVLVPKGSERRVEQALGAAFQKRFPTLRDNPDYSSVASDARRDRVQRLSDEAVGLGARKVELNPARESFDGGRKLPLTLLFDVPSQATVLHEEIFGPVLPVIAYDSLDDAIAYVNERPRPLALYYFDDDPRRVERVLTNTVAGGVTINDTLLHFICNDLPRTAVGDSGLGGYHGRLSFEVFSHHKSVFRQSRVNAVGLLLPPYTKRLDWILRWLIGG